VQANLAKEDCGLNGKTFRIADRKTGRGRDKGRGKGIKTG